MIHLFAQSAPPDLGPLFARAILVLGLIATAGLGFAFARHGLPLIFGGGREEHAAQAKKGLLHTAAGYGLVILAPLVVGIVVFIFKG